MEKPCNAALQILKFKSLYILGIKYQCFMALLQKFYFGIVIYNRGENSISQSLYKIEGKNLK